MTMKNATERKPGAPGGLYYGLGRLPARSAFEALGEGLGLWGNREKASVDIERGRGSVGRAEAGGVGMGYGPDCAGGWGGWVVSGLG